MNTSLNAHYTIAADFELRAKGLEFPLEVWAVAAALSQAETYEALALATGLSDRKVQDAIHQLEAKQLALPQLMTWQEFQVARKAYQAQPTPPAVRAKLITTPDAVQPPIPALPDLEAKPKNVIDIAAAAPAPASPAAAPVQAPAAAAEGPAVSFRMGSISATSVSSAIGNKSWGSQNATAGATRSSSSLSLGSMTATQARTTLQTSKIAATSQNGSAIKPADDSKKTIGRHKNSFATAAPAKVVAAPTAAVEASQFKLRPMLAQIEKLCGGGIEGDLLVYQVFLRVPLDLLREEGITSLNIVDDQTVFSSPALHTAILRATKEVTGFNLQPALAS